MIKWPFKLGDYVTLKDGTELKNKGQIPQYRSVRVTGMYLYTGTKKQNSGEVVCLLNVGRPSERTRPVLAKYLRKVHRGTFDTVMEMQRQASISRRGKRKDNKEQHGSI